MNIWSPRVDPEAENTAILAVDPHTAAKVRTVLLPPTRAVPANLVLEGIQKVSVEDQVFFLRNIRKYIFFVFQYRGKDATFS